jgi:hypothetical protein
LRRQVVEKAKPKAKRTAILHKRPLPAAYLYFPRLAPRSFFFFFFSFFPQPVVGCGTPEGRRKSPSLAAAGDEPYIGRDEAMEGANGVGGSESERKPLSEVVGDCVQRWFQDAYKEARKGDIANQVLVAQMFFSGYGTPKNEYKVYQRTLFKMRSLLIQVPYLVVCAR